MQVNPLSTPSLGVVAGRTSSFLLPDLMKMTGISPQVQTLRQQREDKQHEHQEQLADAGLIPNGSTRAALAAEREMAPNSWAAKQFKIKQTQQEATGRKAAFQRTLGTAGDKEQTESKSTPNSKSSVQPASADKYDASALPRPTKDNASKANPSSESAQPPHPPKLNPPTRSAGIAALSADGSNPKVARVVVARAVENIADTRTAEVRGVKTISAQAVKSVAGGEARPGNPAISADPRTRTTKAAPTLARSSRGEAPQPGKSDTNVERVLRVLRSQIGRENARVTLRLDPPELGTVRLQMDLRKDVLSLRIDTQTTMAHRLLSEQVESLRQGLHATGIELERVEIRPPAATVEADTSNLPRQFEDRPTDHDRSTNPDAEYPLRYGMDSSLAESTEGVVDEAILEPTTESLVNILA